MGTWAGATSTTTTTTDSIARQLLDEISRFNLQEVKVILDQILATLVLYLLVCIALYTLFAVGRRRNRFPDELKRILVVTAHPDDECMFFAPTILSLSRRKDCQVYLLCLSNGNYDKKGSLRRNELWASCRVLGMRPENVILCNSTELQDHPGLEWKAPAVSKVVKKFVDSLGVQAVVTFDQDGVSGHSNHCHIYYAIASLFLTESIPKECRLFTLDTVSVFRKYLLIFDLPTTLLFSSHWFILPWRDFSITRSAMKQHVSQLLWFRYLYIFSSRYMLMNSLRQIRVSDIELDLQLVD